MARGGGGYYAVASGRSEGIFHSWGEAEALVKGFSGAKFQKFSSLGEAQSYLSANRSHPALAPVHNASSNNSNVDAPRNVQQASRKHARDDASAAVPPAKRTHVVDTTKPPVSYYAVTEGHNTGVVTSWPQVIALTQGYARPVFRRFPTLDAAKAFLTTYKRRASSNSATTTADRSPPHKQHTPEAATDSAVVASASSPQQRLPNATTAMPTANCMTADLRPSLTEQFYYAVAKGRRTGVFDTWREAQPLVDGLFNAQYRKFTSRTDAEAFVQRAAAADAVVDVDPQDPSTLVAFCDGSALQNGYRNCAAGFACVFPHNVAWNVAKPLIEQRATNNRAEYFAALEALKRANLEDATQRRPLFIFSDSMLLIRSMTEWIDKWRSNEWCKADKTPVLNRDILEQLVAARGDRRIVWRHVKAHTGKNDWKSKWNDVADREARRAAKEM